MNIFFLMNGNIFNYSLCSPFIGYAIPPNPPASTYTTTREPIFVQSYINAYNTAFNQQLANPQEALNNYQQFTSDDVNNYNFIIGTFGYDEQYNLQSGTYFTINALQDDVNAYSSGTPCLFISAGSGGGAGFMYLDWVIVTYGVPYVVSVS